MKLKSYSDYPIETWKNGGGTTALIGKQSADESMGEWRLSAATVRAPGPFSDYSGKTRLLFVWRGEGMWLNDFLLKPKTVFEFDGGENIFCKQIGAEVVDLGLIFDPSRVRAFMKHHEVFGNLILSLPAGHNFIFCAQASVKIAALEMSEGDSFEIQVGSSQKLEIFSLKAQLVHVCIQNL